MQPAAEKSLVTKILKLLYWVKNVVKKKKSIFASKLYISTVLHYISLVAHFIELQSLLSLIKELA